nr:unnamed protein product [Digitaria exilis]
MSAAVAAAAGRLDGREAKAHHCGRPASSRMRCEDGKDVGMLRQAVSRGRWKAMSRGRRPGGVAPAMGRAMAACGGRRWRREAWGSREAR